MVANKKCNRRVRTLSSEHVDRVTYYRDFTRFSWNFAWWVKTVGRKESL